MLTGRTPIPIVMGQALCPLPLPIDEVLPQIVAALRTSKAVVLRAPTGAGKTTRVPPAVLDAGLARGGSIVVLQPRRLTATGLCAADRFRARRDGWAARSATRSASIAAWVRRRGSGSSPKASSSACSRTTRSWNRSRRWCSTSSTSGASTATWPWPWSAACRRPCGRS